MHVTEMKDFRGALFLFGNIKKNRWANYIAAETFLSDKKKTK